MPGVVTMGKNVKTLSKWCIRIVILVKLDDGDENNVVI